MKSTYISILTVAVMSLPVISCSNDNDPQLTHRDWDTTTWFAPTDEASPSTFYKPAVGYVADPMPFYDPKAGDFKIMYLQEYRPNQSGTYHPFWCVSTKDGASYQSLGEMIPTGSIEEQDAALGTGSVYYNEADQTYYTFYTGHAYRPDITGYGEMVMLATSKDFKTWTKDRALLVGGGDVYSHFDFRDPMVFKGDDGKFHMIVSTKKSGKGVIAEYVSDDLRNWDMAGDFMNMMWDRFYECPDVFKMGDWWYLVYSEMHDAIRKVQYFKGRTLEDLKACTANDAGLWPDGHEGFLDSRGLYAAKTAGNGQDRYIWGWCATRAGEDNTAQLEWAGTLVGHKLIQHEDGTLTLGEMPAVAAKFGNAQTPKLKSVEGTANLNGNQLTMEGEAAAVFGRLDKHSRISFTVKTTGDEDNFGVSFGRASDVDKWISLVVNAEGVSNRKINMEQQGPAGIGFLGNQDGYLFERPDDNVYRVTIVVDNSVCAVYINDKVSYTNRIYGMAQNCWSINSYGGKLEISDLTVQSY